MIKIFDGHNDTLTNPFQQEKDGISVFFNGSKFQFDLPAAKKGGFAGGFFSIFTPLETEKKGGGISGLSREKKFAKTPTQEAAEKYTDSILKLLFQIERQSKSKVKIIKKYLDLENCFRKRILAMIMHFEGAEAIKTDLSNLETYYNKGLRSLGFVWSRDNKFGRGVPFKYPHSPDTGEGLTKAGHELVKACNELGIIIDLAHINEKGFWDVAKKSKNPLIVTHAGVHVLCPSSRNLTDKQIEAVGKSGGVIGIIFTPSMIKRKTPHSKIDNNMPLDEIINHVKYVSEKIGVEHVAFGSDFDGADMPLALKDVSRMQKLIKALEKAGYNSEEKEKIANGNWLRVIKQTMQN